MSDLSSRAGLQVGSDAAGQAGPSHAQSLYSIAGYAGGGQMGDSRKGRGRQGFQIAIDGRTHGARFVQPSDLGEAPHAACIRDRIIMSGPDEQTYRRLHGPNVEGVQIV